MEQERALETACPTRGATAETEPSEATAATAASAVIGSIATDAGIAGIEDAGAEAVVDQEEGAVGVGVGLGRGLLVAAVV